MLYHNRKKDFAFVLGCHERVRELLGHLALLEFCKVSHDVIVLHSGKDNLREVVAPAYYVEVDKKTLDGWGIGKKVDGNQAATFILVRGIKVAKELGYRYINYRNGDDWVLNHSRVEIGLEKLKAGYKMCGFNWFGAGRYDDYCASEWYLDLDVIQPSLVMPVLRKLLIDAAIREPSINPRLPGDMFEALEHCFTQLMPYAQCEFVLGRFLNSLIPNDKVFKLEEREKATGVGHDREFSDNCRVFNRPWQMITSHDQIERRHLLNLIKTEVPYYDELKEMEHFKYWTRL